MKRYLKAVFIIPFIFFVLLLFILAAPVLGVAFLLGAISFFPIMIFKKYFNGDN